MTRIIPDMPAAEYHASAGLSHSAMKDLQISPLRFWYNHVRPDREPVEPTQFMEFGRALHSRVLDSPDTFDSQFCCAFDASVHEGALDTVPQMRAWYLSETGNKAKGTSKEEIAAQIRLIPEHPLIVMDAEASHFKANEGKHILSVEDWKRLNGCAQSLLREPEFQRLIEKGNPEVSYFVTDPETDVNLKARMDWVAPTHTLDPKTFSQKGKDIDRTVVDAMHYEGYFRQGYLYTYIRHLAGDPIVPFINAFVESEPPHEVRIRQQVRATAGEENLYWTMARNEVTRLIRLYATLRDRFGTDPWRTDASVETLADEDIPALAWG